MPTTLRHSSGYSILIYTALFHILARKHSRGLTRSLQIYSAHKEFVTGHGLCYIIPRGVSQTSLYASTYVSVVDINLFAVQNSTFLHDSLLQSCQNLGTRSQASYNYWFAKFIPVKYWGRCIYIYPRQLCSSKIWCYTVCLRYDSNHKSCQKHCGKTHRQNSDPPPMTLSHCHLITVPRTESMVGNPTIAQLMLHGYDQIVMSQ